MELDHHIYFAAGAEIERFKIGRTQNLPARMKTLQSGAPCELKCVAWTSGAIELEAACHDAAETLGFERAYGEWFKGELNADTAARIVQRARVRLSKASEKERDLLERRSNHKFAVAY